MTLAERFPQYRIGRGTYGGDLVVFSWNEGAVLEIGHYTSIGPGVRIFLGGEHRTDWVTTFPFNWLWPCAQHYTGHPKTKGDVVIGSDVWIGAEAMIMSGVTIGDGAVIGARAVVARNVPPYAIVVGNPARFLRCRFDEKTIDRLLALRWWDWPEADIAHAMPDLLSGRISSFLEKAETGSYRFCKGTFA
ncbi:CatB-related O-acetyltransferase [Methylosinus sporium]|uniref:CatB-related O-acetyltransferase n=1 Tax=Methylosinus sporium TaxID=428 RepID=A0A549SHG2_METSR|nr:MULTISPECIES: CatB-related O-acetyltransferase [Methylosinus]MBU3888549.1 CatB-related O-acetyltransferase [Methylosinus sp. KRF6]TRL29078.1 CatB-related O-acetyltransferase [Methylosinus sporium]